MLKRANRKVEVQNGQTVSWKGCDREDEVNLIS